MSNSNWTIDNSHSGIHFKIRHLVIAKVRGSFTRWSSKIALDPNDLSRSSLEVTIDAASITTNEDKRDAHLRSADFFDVERFPALTFRSRRIERLTADRLKVVGDLTIRDVTREVALDVSHEGGGKDPWGNTRFGFSAQAAIDRKDFGLTWNQVLDAGGLAVGDKVEIEIEAEVVQAAAQQAA